MWYHGEGDVAAFDRSPLQDREIVHRRDEMAAGRAGSSSEPVG